MKNMGKLLNSKPILRLAFAILSAVFLFAAGGCDPDETPTGVLPATPAPVPTVPPFIARATVEVVIDSVESKQGSASYTAVVSNTGIDPFTTVKTNSTGNANLKILLSPEGPGSLEPECYMSVNTRAEVFPYGGSDNTLISMETGAMSCSHHDNRVIGVEIEGAGEVIFLGTGVKMSLHPGEDATIAVAEGSVRFLPFVPLFEDGRLREEIEMPEGDEIFVDLVAQEVEQRRPQFSEKDREIFEVLGISIPATITEAVDEPVTVASVVGQQVDRATETLKRLGLEVGQIFDLASNRVRGTVIDQNPGAGRSVLPGSTVDLFVSSGPTATKAPAPTATKAPASAATKAPVSAATKVPDPTATKGPAPTATKAPTQTPPPVFDGVYELLVLGTPGDIITFAVNGLAANESRKYVSGDAEELALTTPNPQSETIGGVFEPQPGGRELPHGFWGTANIKGVPAPEGATVTAWQNGSLIGSTTVVSRTSVTIDTDEVAQLFGELSSNLVRVWRFDNKSSNWSVFDPRKSFLSVQSIENVSDGDIFWVNISTRQGFKGLGLFLGWNVISIQGSTAVATNLELELGPAKEVFADLPVDFSRVWRFENESQTWAFYDPRPAFAAANTIRSAYRNDIIWVNINQVGTVRGSTLVPGWNLIILR